MLQQLREVFRLGDFARQLRQFSACRIEPMVQDLRPGSAVTGDNFVSLGAPLLLHAEQSQQKPAQQQT